MNKQIKTTIIAAVASLVIAPIIVAFVGAGLGWALMGEVIVIAVFIVLAVLIIGLSEDKNHP